MLSEPNLNNDSNDVGHGQSAIGIFTVDNISYYRYADGSAHVYRFESGNYNNNTKRYEHYFNPVNIPESVTYGGITYPVDGIETASSSDKKNILSGKLIIPSSIKLIDNNSFYSCSNLTGNLIIPTSVTKIGYCVFSGCTGFTGDLTLPEGLLSVGNNAFSDCSGLNGTLTIPSTLKSVGEQPFLYCSKLNYAINNSELSIPLPNPGTKKIWIKCDTLQYAKKVNYVYQAEADSEYMVMDYVSPATLPQAVINKEGYALASFVLTDKDGKVLRDTELNYRTSDGEEGTATSDSEGIVKLKSALKTYNAEDSSKNTGSVRYCIVVDGDTKITKLYDVNYKITPLTYDRKLSGTITLKKYAGKESNINDFITNNGGTTWVALSKGMAEGNIGGTFSMDDLIRENGNHDYDFETTYKVKGIFNFSTGDEKKANSNANPAIKGIKNTSELCTAVSFGYLFNDKEGLDSTETGKVFVKSAASVMPAATIFMNQVMNAAGWNDSLAGGPDYCGTEINAMSSSAINSLIVEKSDFFQNKSPKVEYGTSIKFNSKYRVWGGDSVESELSVSGEAGESNKLNLDEVYNLSATKSYSLKYKKNLSDGSRTDFVLSQDYSETESAEGVMSGKQKRNMNINIAASDITSLKKFAAAGDNNFKGIVADIKEVLAELNDVSKNTEGTFSDTISGTGRVTVNVNFKNLLASYQDKTISIDMLLEDSFKKRTGTYKYNDDAKSYLALPSAENSIDDICGTEVKKDIDIYNTDFNLGVEYVLDSLEQYANRIRVETAEKVIIGVGLAALAIIALPAIAAEGGIAAVVSCAAMVPAYAVSSYDIQACNSTDNLLKGTPEKREVCKTVGRAFDICFEDSEGNPIEGMLSSPAEFSIAYTEAELAEAGADLSDVSKLAMYSYSEQLGCYERVGGTLDESNKMVTAQVYRSGTYILALNTIAPQIENLNVSDSSCAPTITADIFCLGGLKDFSLKIDNEELLNKDNVNRYFDEATGDFEYKIARHLEPGNHVLSINATDASDNSLDTPFIHEFTINDIHHQAKVESVSLILGDGIAANFYMRLSEDIAENGHIYANSRECEIIGPEADGTYKVIAEMKAKELGDTILLEVKCDGMQPVELENNVSVGGKLRYSVRDYINSVNKGNDKLAKLAGALDSYGYYAQNYFGYKVPENLPVIDPVSIVGNEKRITGTRPSGIKYAGSTLVLRSKTAIRHYFNVSDDISKYSFKVEGVEMTPLLSADGLYYIEISNIAPVLYGKLFKTTISDGSSSETIEYSALSYCESVMNEGSNENLMQLISSMYLYGKAAEDYFKNQN